MNRIPEILLLFVLVWGCSQDSDVLPEVEEPKKNELLIAGYLPRYGMDIIDMKNLELINRLYYFSIEPDESGNFVSEQSEIDHLQLLNNELNDDQELFVVLGGWFESENIHTMAATAESRKNYAIALLQFCKDHYIDGVDLDWEAYPKSVNDSHYIELVKELYKTLNPNGIKFTIAIDIGHSERTQKLIGFYDQVNLMFYGKMDEQGNHATLNQMKEWLPRFTSKGITKNELIIGVPFYGKRLVIDGDTSPRAITYRKIASNSQPAYGVNQYGNYSFNGRSLLQQKTEYLMQEGYLGIMSWELSQDVSVTSDFSLLKTIYNTANK